MRVSVCACVWDGFGVCSCMHGWVQDPPPPLLLRVLCFCAHYHPSSAGRAHPNPHTRPRTHTLNGTPCSQLVEDNVAAGRVAVASACLVLPFFHDILTHAHARAHEHTPPWASLPAACGGFCGGGRGRRGQRMSWALMVLRYACLRCSRCVTVYARVQTRAYDRDHFSKIRLSRAQVVC